MQGSTLNPPPPTRAPSVPAWRWLFGTLLVLLVVVLVRTAWLCDDAYITFRTVDHLVHGRGAVWNVGERVQVHTHPLWMVAVAGARLATGELYYTVLFLAMGLTVAAVVGLGRSLGAGAAACAALVGLASSKAFVDFSTAGLENPLSHVLAVLFLALFLRPHAERRLAPLVFLVGLAMTTRVDLVLLYLPALVAAAWGRPWRSVLAAAVLGFAPFALWEVFSVVYYGFPLPNVAYAKLGTGIPRGELLAQGLHYLSNSWQRDAVTLATIGAAAVVGLASPRARLHGSVAIVLGIALYLGYVVRIGGDFMSGRMLTVPLVASVVVIGRSLRDGAPGLRTGLAGAWALAALALALSEPNPSLTSGATYGADVKPAAAGDGQGVADERLFYYRATGLLRADRPHARGTPRAEEGFERAFPSHAWARAGLEARAGGFHVETRRTVGFFSFFAGPAVHVVDEHALTDPLLARIPRIEAKPASRGGRPWRPGHFRRALPAGYVASLASGEDHLASPELSEYLRRLHVVVRGPLFTAERWREIGRFLTGENRSLMDAYLASLEE